MKKFMKSTVDVVAKDGIHNEKELDAAIKNMKLLNIGGFVNKLEVIKSENS